MAAQTALDGVRFNGADGAALRSGYFDDTLCTRLEYDAEYILSALFDCEFEANDGGPDFGLHIAWSWSAGLEVVSPARSEEDTENAYSKMGWDYLAKRGEGLFAVVMGVDDVQEAIERARALGCEPSPLLYLPATEKLWRNRVQECTESVLDVFLDQNLAVGRIITDEPVISASER